MSTQRNIYPKLVDGSQMDSLCLYVPLKSTSTSKDLRYLNFFSSQYGKNIPKLREPSISSLWLIWSSLMNWRILPCFWWVYTHILWFKLTCVALCMNLVRKSAEWCYISPVFLQHIFYMGANMRRTARYNVVAGMAARIKFAIKML